MIKAKDIQIGMNKKIRLVLRSSKTHWTSDPPQIVKLTAQPCEHNEKQTNHKDSLLCCPFLLLQRYAAMCKSYKSEDEQFFVFSDRMPVNPDQYRKTLKLCLSLAGFIKENYDTLSMQAGRSCDLMKMGVSVETMKILGH